MHIYTWTSISYSNNVVHFLPGNYSYNQSIRYDARRAQGPLKEALHITSKAKARFPEHQTGLYARASRLVRESLEAGVTIMRA